MYSNPPMRAPQAPLEVPCVSCAADTWQAFPKLINQVFIELFNQKKNIFRVWHTWVFLLLIEEKYNSAAFYFTHGWARALQEQELPPERICVIWFDSMYQN